MAEKIWDISVPYSSDLTGWPGAPPPEIKRYRAISDGFPVNVSRISGGVHSGTHLDAPVHFIDGATGVDRIPLQQLIGPAYVVDVGEVPSVTAAVLDGVDLPDGIERLLLKTTNSALWADPSHEFDEDFVALSADAAEWVVDRGITLIGIDYMSIESYHSTDNQTHLTLLGAGIVIVEALDLRAISDGFYQLICLPLKITGCDGAPVRAVLMEAG